MDEMVRKHKDCTYADTDGDSLAKRCTDPERKEISSGMVEGLHRERARRGVRTVAGELSIGLAFSNIEPGGSLHQRVELS